MHERAVRRVHQAHDARVHAAGKIGGEMRDAIALAEFRQLRDRRDGRAIDGASLGIRQVYPNVAVAFLARKTARVDAVALKLGIRRDRGNLAALSRVRAKAPAGIRALDRLPIALSGL